jgi:hypothetical protein
MSIGREEVIVTRRNQRNMGLRSFAASKVVVRWVAAAIPRIGPPVSRDQRVLTYLRNHVPVWPGAAPGAGPLTIRRAGLRGMRDFF